MPLYSARHVGPMASFSLDAWFHRAVVSRWLGALTVVTAAIQQALGHMNCDTSWFMTFAEKVLDGAVPYVDVSDPNPPAAFLAYLPALLLARLTHIRPEIVVDLAVFAGAFVAMRSTGYILRRYDLLRSRELVPAFTAASYVLLVVPAFCFAEREHIAVILLLPVLAVCAARVNGAHVSRSISAASGLAAGLALAFKPYYVLPFAMVALCAPIRRRDWRFLLAAEVMAAIGIVVLYGGAIVFFFPAYLRDVLPAAAGIYAAAREPLAAIVQGPAFIFNVWLLFAIVCMSRRRWDPRVVVLFVASVGFLATYLIQSKGWMNHAYPGLALALIAGTLVLLSDAPLDAEQHRRFGLPMVLPVLVAAPFFFGAIVDWTDREEYPGLRAEVARLAPPNPKIAALSEQVDVGHPLIRRLGGTWVGQQNCLWMDYTVRYLLDSSGNHIDGDQRARLLDVKALHERTFAEDVARDKPDVLLVETPALEHWAQEAETMKGLFAPYQRAGQAGEIAIWLRRQG